MNERIHLSIQSNKLIKPIISKHTKSYHSFAISISPSHINQPRDPSIMLRSLNLQTIWVLCFAWCCSLLGLRGSQLNPFKLLDCLRLGFDIPQAQLWQGIKGHTPHKPRDFSGFPLFPTRNMYGIDRKSSFRTTANRVCPYKRIVSPTFAVP